MAKKTLQYSYVKPTTIAHRTLIYGEPASGKTTIAASLNTSEHWGPVLFLNIDEGLSSVSNMPNLRQVPIHSVDDLGQVVADLSRPVNEKDEFLRPVKTVVIDSLSALKDELLIEFTGQQFAKGRREDSYSPEWKDYGKMTNYLAGRLDDLRAMGIHVVVLAGAAPLMQDEMQIGIRPNLNAKLLERLNYGLSHIWYAELDTKRNRYHLQVGRRPKNNTLTKNRNAVYTKALRELTLKEAQQRGEDPTQEVNRYVIPSHTHTTLAILYDLYLSSGAEKDEKEQQ